MRRWVNFTAAVCLSPPIGSAISSSGGVKGVGSGGCLCAGPSTHPISPLVAVSLTKSANHFSAHGLKLNHLQGPSDKVAMALKALTDDEKTELKDQFGVIDKDESGFINLSELKEALDLAGFKVPGWRVMNITFKKYFKFIFFFR